MIMMMIIKVLLERRWKEDDTRQEKKVIKDSGRRVKKKIRQFKQTKLKVRLGLLKFFRFINRL